MPTEYYRKQAKALLKAARSGDPASLERLSRYAVNYDPAAPKLHNAQLAIAREQGFASWPRFRTFVIQSGLDDRGLAARFIDTALEDLRRAEEILAARPQVAAAGFYVALVLGDWKRVERALMETPSPGTGRGGPKNWEPLLYVCFSRFAGRASSRSGDLMETARVLLRHGLHHRPDPNARFIPEDWPDNPLSCLYGATGVNNNPALALALLEAGADPNDSESLYHSTERRDLECVKLLLRHGATPAGTNALAHMLDREDLEGVRLLLAAYANPNEVNDKDETALHWAVWRRRSAPIIAALLDSGADLDAQRKDGRTAYALAVQSGQTEVAALLEARGAKADDRFLGACATADPGELDRLLATRPDLAGSPGIERLLPDLAMNHHTAAVRALLAAGMPVDARGDMGATALHWACWKGDADLVELLLNHGASLTIEDQQFQGTPPGWFGHGVHNCDEGGGDYPRVARLLIAMGAAIPSVDLPTGRPDVDAVLRELGLI